MSPLRHALRIGLCLPLGLGTLLGQTPSPVPPPPPALPALTVKGEDFVDASGNPVRFWGVNAVSFYPDHTQADAMAANLAALQVNLVRPHHLLRASKDWNPSLPSGAIVTYEKDSREFEPGTLDRFDYFNAACKRNGIYLAFSAHFSRTFRPGDVDIVPATDPKDQADRQGWMAAMAELNGYNWKKLGDAYKNLPVFDERCALLAEEFNRKLLAHVNPYTGLSYAAEPQVLTYEVLNEASIEYSIICNNRFPDYFQAELTAKWEAYAAAAGIAPGDLYKPADAKAKEVRARFLRKLDQDYFDRIKAVIRGAGCQAPITFSNLWRGENATQMSAEHADHVENHQYMDPYVVGAANDGIAALAKNAVAGKPYFIGEFNQAEGEKNIAKQAPTRTMLPLVGAAYGSLQNWSGIVWFAWTHGAKTVGANGRSTAEGRAASLGAMIDDGMMIDHMRTAGTIFRRGLVAKSKEPVTVWVDEPLFAADYNGLMRGKYNHQPGWQDVHEIRKAFGPVPSGQAEAPWMKQAPANPIVSDTGEIVKDLERKQLTVAAPQAEAFSGLLDGKPAAGPQHLLLDGAAGGFATVFLVSDDGQPLSESGKLILSRTGLDATNAETASPAVRVAKLKAPGGDLHWYFRATRPRTVPAAEAVQIEPGPDGALALPAVDWHEAELELRK